MSYIFFIYCLIIIFCFTYMACVYGKKHETFLIYFFLFFNMSFHLDNKNTALYQARLAYQRVAAGEDFFSVKQQLSSPEVLSIPNSPLPPNKLRQYIGPALTEAALAMQSGTISEPLEDGNGYTLLYVTGNETAQARPFDEIKDLVASEYRRRAGDNMLRDYLQRLREQADIRIDEKFLSQLPDNQ